MKGCGKEGVWHDVEKYVFSLFQTAAESPANIINHGLLTQPNLHKYVRGVCTLPYMDRGGMCLTIYGQRDVPCHMWTCISVVIDTKFKK